jgi:hypothetical protein
MVYIVTGRINSGKTTKMIELFKGLNGQRSVEGMSGPGSESVYATGNATSNDTGKDAIDYNRLDMNSDGFIAEKIMVGNQVNGYKATQLSNGNQMDLIVREEDVAKDYETLCQVGPYCLSKKAVGWIEACIKVTRYDIKKYQLIKTGD